MCLVSSCFMKFVVQADVDGGRRMSQVSDADPVDAGGGNIANGFESDTARRFQQDRGRHLVSPAHRHAQNFGAHVVQENDIGSRL